MNLFRMPPITLAVVIILTSISFSLPRFTAMSEQKCNLCHVSPTGGGMRNSFGAQFFAFSELASHKTPFEDIPKFQTQVSDIISLGADMRSTYLDDANADQSTFFQMEGNFYASAQLNKEFSLTLDKGLYSGFEVYGLAYILPYAGYLRAGKFQPAYGWRFGDHTSFVREKLLWPAGSTDTGIEAGVYPHGVSFNLGLFNGTGDTFDNDKKKAIAGRLEYRHNIEGIGLGVGGSYWLNRHVDGDVKMFGPFGYLDLFNKKLIYLGEIDWLENQVSVTDKTAEAMTHKLNYLVTRGLWFMATYDFYDPDIDFKTGKTSRYGLGIDYFPYGFLELQPIIWIYQDDFSTDNNYTKLFAQAHFFF